MTDVPDSELTRDFADRQSEAAFAQLVERHISLVYSVALRFTGHAEDARDVTQAVFIILAHKAAGLRQRATLTGWLYETTRLTARQFLRTRARQFVRDQEAYMQSHLNEPDTDGVWQQLAPQLEAAMSRLNENERALLALRYFENRTGEEAAALLGIRADAAHKRTARAVEKLRGWFTKRGVTLSGAVLTAAISANSVQAAPLGLAATVTTTAVKGAVVSGSTLTLIKGGLKVMAWTKAKMMVAVGVGAALVGTSVYQAQQAAQLREQNQILQQAQAPLAEQIQQLQTERDGVSKQLADLRGEMAKENRNNSELLRLRNELTMLKRNQSVNRNPSTETVKNNEPSSAGIGQELGAAVVRGDAGAFSKLFAEIKSEQQSFKTNAIGLDQQQQNELSARIFTPINEAFKIIGDAATQGNQPALDALTQALQTPELRGLAVNSLGGLAGNGDAGALEVLLHPEKYGALLSSTISALQPAAENGNQMVIDVLAAIAADQNKQPLWSLVANDLAKPAASGNSAAIDALISMSSCTNRSIQNAVAEALRSAAANQNAKAAEALRAMGMQ